MDTMSPSFMNRFRSSRTSQPLTSQPNAPQNREGRLVGFRLVRLLLILGVFILAVIAAVSVPINKAMGFVSLDLDFSASTLAGLASSKRSALPIVAVADFEKRDTLVDRQLSGIFSDLTADVRVDVGVWGYCVTFSISADGQETCYRNFTDMSIATSLGANVTGAALSSITGISDVESKITAVGKAWQGLQVSAAGISFILFVASLISVFTRYKLLPVVCGILEFLLFLILTVLIVAIAIVFHLVNNIQNLPLQSSSLGMGFKLTCAALGLLIIADLFDCMEGCARRRMRARTLRDPSSVVRTVRFQETEKETEKLIGARDMSQHERNLSSGSEQSLKSDIERGLHHHDHSGQFGDVVLDGAGPSRGRSLSPIWDTERGTSRVEESLSHSGSEQGGEGRRERANTIEFPNNGGRQ